MEPTTRSIRIAKEAPQPEPVLVVDLPIEARIIPVKPRWWQRKHRPVTWISRRGNITWLS